MDEKYALLEQLMISAKERVRACVGGLVTQWLADLDAVNHLARS